jgi:hypothetical protein
MVLVVAMTKIMIERLSMIDKKIPAVQYRSFCYELINDSGCVW